MTAITGKLQGHFSSVPHSAAGFGKPGVRWCQKKPVWNWGLISDGGAGVRLIVATAKRLHQGP
jgi:hypothetical protein